MKAIISGLPLLVILSLAGSVSGEILVYRGVGQARFIGANRVVPLTIRSWDLHDTETGTIHTVGYFSAGGQKYYTSQRTTNAVRQRIFAPPRDRLVLASTESSSPSNIVNMVFYKGLLYDLDLGNGRRTIGPRVLTGFTRGLVDFPPNGPVLYEGSDTLTWNRAETMRAYTLGTLEDMVAYYVQWVEQRGYHASP